MYDKQVIARRLAAAQQSLDFTLARHATAKTREWSLHLDDLLDDNGKLDRKKRPRGLLPTEVQWIRNERTLCQCDFLYAATRYFKVIDEGKSPVMFRPRTAQTLNIRVWAEHEAKSHPIEIIQLKARQLGMSTLTELAIAHRIFFWPYTHAVIASSDPEKSLGMSKMLEFVYDELPWWLAPERTKYQAGSLMEFNGINTTLSIQHGNKISGIARGSTPNCVHLSELPDFEDPEELVDASLLPAIHPSPNTFLILESTAKGFGNWWYRSWKAAKEKWPRGRSRLRPVFLPWYVATDIKPTRTWVKQNITDRGLDLDLWEPQITTLKHKDRAQDYVHNTPLLQSLLGAGYTIPPEQLYWWELTREEYYDKRELNKFLEENPADDTEAFQSETTSVFPVEDMEGFNAQVREPIAAYALRGSEVPDKFWPDPREIDPVGRTISIMSDWNRQHISKFDLVPLKWHGYDNSPWENRILIWEYPERGEEYGLGVDTAYGMDQDRSAIEGLKRSNLYHVNAQVFEYANAKLSAEEMWPWCMALGTFYSPDARQCRMNIEVNGTGRLLQLAVRMRGWSNFHPWLHYDRKQIKQANAHVLGWVTNAQSRRDLMVKTIRGLRAGWLEVRSKYLVEEMQGLQKEEDDAYITSLYGFHDDRWMAYALIYFSLNVLELEQQSQPRPDPNQLVMSDLPTYRSHYK